MSPESPDFITATVLDPFGNILGIMNNPHTRAILESLTRAAPAAG